MELRMHKIVAIPKDFTEQICVKRNAQLLLERFLVLFELATILVTYLLYILHFVKQKA